MDSVEIREELIKTLRLDLVGPHESYGNPDEILDQAPSRFYLTGFLVPVGSIGERRSAEETDDDSLDQITNSLRRDETDAPDRPAAKKKFFPASMGLSFIIADQTKSFDVAISWGDYIRKEAPPTVLSGMEHATASKASRFHWHRINRSENITIKLENADKHTKNIAIPNSGNLTLFYSIRPAPVTGAFAEHIPVGARVVSVFLVNHRSAEAGAPRGRTDELFAFQARLEIAMFLVCLSAFSSFMVMFSLRLIRCQ